MKRLSLLLVMIFIVCMSWAAIGEFYSFNATTGTYTPITGTALATVSDDDAISEVVPLGFTFPYGDANYTEIKVCSNGWLDLSGLLTSTSFSNALASTTIKPVVAPLWDDLSLAAGTAQYLLSGTAPNRVFTVQWENAAWNYSAENQFNFQVRLHENGKIQLVYGPSTGAPASSSASIGINMLPGAAGWYYSVTPGSPATVSSTAENNTIAAFPAEGTIYEFIPVPDVDIDMAALTITGSTTPTQGTAANYVVTVKNNGLLNAASYSVKLIKNGTTEVATQAGSNLAPGATQTHSIAWTPDVAGPATLAGRAVITGDMFANNDNTAAMNLAVQPAGVSAVTIGDGSATGLVPVDMYYKNSLFENIYFQDELGIASGSISSVTFYNNFVTDLPNMPVKIWLGTTTSADLSAGWIPSTQLTQVFDGTVNFPTGANTITIPFSAPFNYTGGNLVMMVNRPMDTDYYSSSDVFLAQTIGTTRARRASSDSTPFDPAAPPTTTATSGLFPKTTFFYTGTAVTTDLGVVSLAGNTTPTSGTASLYTVVVRNNGSATQTNYQVKLFKEGNVELASVAGTSIAPLATAEFNLSWTPSAAGATYIYAKVVLTGDQIAVNDQSPNYPVVVQEAGVVAITIGTGGSTARMPVDMFYKNSLFERLYLSSELNIGGLLTGIQFYNNFSTDLPNMPVKIWAGETQVADLSGGWVPSTALTLVFDGTVNFPTGANNINIPFTTPLPYGGGNLVIMVNRPMDTQYYSSADTFVSQTVGTNRTLNVSSDSTPFDPTAPPVATASGVFPKTTFFFITEGMGALTGTVTVNGTPLAGASVTVANSMLNYTTGADGTYTFPYIFEGPQTISVTKHGYNVVTHIVTVIEDQTVTQNFALTQLPQVTVTGKIVGSDNPTVGIAGATVALSGYEPYNATTNATGDFTINNVYASQTYNYTANAAGYQPATGQVVVGTVNVNMGNITVNEIANPVSGVVATEAANFSNVSLTWNEPGVGPSGFTDDFESYTNFSIAFEPWTLVDVDLSTTYGFSGITFEHSGEAMSYIIFNPSATTPVLEQTPHSGAKFAACFASTTPPNNDWMISPQTTVNASDVVSFWARSYVADYGLERFKVGVSTTGTAPADFTIISGANYISAPVEWTQFTYNLAAYAGQQVRIGVQCLSNDAFIFFLDDFFVGTPANMPSYPEVAVNQSATVARTADAPKYVGPTASERQDAANDRTRLGYRVWRLLAADQANEAAWTSLTPATITPTNYVDNAWQPLPSGVYKYAVKAVYTNNVYSVPAFSNEIHKGMMGTLTGTITEFGTGLPIAGVTVTAGTYTGTTNASGVYSFGVYAGTYNVTAVKAGYQPASQAGVVMVGLQVTTQNFVMTELTLPPSGVLATQAGNNVNITWSAPGSGSVGFEDDFESYADFSIAFDPWTLVDVDLSETYGFSGITFPNSGVAMAYIIFNPTTCTPALEETPHSGSKFAACFASTTPPNNDWLISPQTTVMAGDAVSFWARSYVADYGLERFKVGVSTTGTAPADFTIISGASYISAPVDWTEYSYSLASYAGQQVYVGIQCLSNDAFIFFVDDFAIGAPATREGFIASENKPEDIARVDVQTQNIGNIQVNAEKRYNPSNTVVSIQPSIDLRSLVTTDNTRALLGYKVWRMIAGQETNEPAWTSLTTNPVSATAYQDTGWGTLPDGTYKWAVKAVYTGGALSTPALSNPVTKMTQVGTIAGIVRNQQNQVVSGATVATGTYTATTNAQGAYSMVVPVGTHTVVASHPNYSSATQSGVVVLLGQTTTANFILAPTANLLVDGFEEYADFSLTFAPWTLVDVDLSATYGFSGITFQNSGSAMAYIVFNPSATTPALEQTPHGGSKFAASFASTTPPNNDWLITPRFMNGASQIKFWARSYVADYGLERFKVGVSTTGTAPADFNIISGANYVSAPVEWTEYTYNLSTGNSPVYIGIQCLSNDAFIFFVDDVTVIGGGSANGDITVPVVATELKSNYPNPFNPETNIAFSMKEAANVSIEVYNVKGQLVRTLLNDVKEAGNHTVVWNGKDNNGRGVSSGVYYYKMNTGKYSSTKKMIMMK